MKKGGRGNLLCSVQIWGVRSTPQGWLVAVMLAVLAHAQVTGHPQAHRKMQVAVDVQPQMRPAVQVADPHVRGRSRPMVTASTVVRVGGGNGKATLRFRLDETGALRGDVLSHSMAKGGDVAGGIAAGLSYIVVPGD